MASTAPIAPMRPGENNHPERDPGGKAATFGTQGSVSLTGEFFQPRGSNGRGCASCHAPGDAWSITPGTLQHLFDETGGTHPAFNRLDASNPRATSPRPRACSRLTARR